MACSSTADVGNVVRRSFECVSRRTSEAASSPGGDGCGGGGGGGGCTTSSAKCHLAHAVAAHGCSGPPAKHREVTPACASHQPHEPPAAAQALRVGASSQDMGAPSRAPSASTSKWSGGWRVVAGCSESMSSTLTPSSGPGAPASSPVAVGAGVGAPGLGRSSAGSGRLPGRRGWGAGVEARGYPAGLYSGLGVRLETSGLARWEPL